MYHISELHESRSGRPGLYVPITPYDDERKEEELGRVQEEEEDDDDDDDEKKGTKSGQEKPQ